jgi:hypothetical protein
VPRKGCVAAPAIFALMQKSRGCYAALSRHEAAPTEVERMLLERNHRHKKTGPRTGFFDKNVA